MPTGTVKWFDQKKGYGFIQKEDGNDVFVHISAVQSAGWETLREGQKLSFEIQKDPKRNKESAANLQEEAA